MPPAGKGRTKFNKMLKTLFALSVIVTFFLLMPSCKKSGGGGSSEAGLVVELTPANSSVQAAAPGPDFPLVVKITSTMPSAGVKIDISSQKDGSTDPAFFTFANNSNSATNNFSITGTPSGIVCTTTVKVSSLSSSSNVWTGSYKYSKK